MDDTKKCAYSACCCGVSVGSHYCSPNCETAAAEPAGGACECQHASCDATVRSGAQASNENGLSDAAVGDREKTLDKTLADSYPASDLPSSIPNPA